MKPPRIDAVTVLAPGVLEICWPRLDHAYGFNESVSPLGGGGSDLYKHPQRV